MPFDDPGTVPPHSTDPQSLPLILALFAAFGLMWGIWAVMLADIKEALSLSAGELGAALTVGTVASLPAMFHGGALADRLGVRHVIVAAALGVAAALVGFSLTGHFALFTALLLLLFGTSGAYDVGINAAAVRFEQVTHRRVMSYFHAAFSGAAAVGAMSAGVLLALGVGFRILYLLAALLMVGIAVLAGRGRGLAPGRSEPAGTRATGLYRDATIVLIGVIAGLGMLSESTLESWSVIYLRSYLDLPAVLGASGVAVFQAAMFLGRMGTGPVVARFSRRRVLQATGVLVAAGMSLALTTASPALILAGFLIVGLGLATVVPVGFSLAGDLAPGRAGEAASVVAMLGYTGFLIGPALIGGLAQWWNLRLALASVIVAGVLILVLGSGLRSGRN